MIILTDFPKTEHIDANLRGVPTERLIELNEQLRRTMMISHSEECGGFVIHYDYKAIEEELKFRKVNA